jgi:hypothetical protein
MARYLYSELASTLTARINTLKEYQRTGIDNVWFGRHADKLDQLISDFMPSGSGFDRGTDIDLAVSHSEKLVFTTSFHHMDENGSYDGWTDHIVTVTPSFNGINLRVSGRNKNDIKEYIADTFHTALTAVFTPYHEIPEDFAKRIKAQGEIHDADVMGLIARRASHEALNLLDLRENRTRKN